MPKENDSENRKYRYPYVSSEMLGIESPLIYNALLPEGKPSPQLKKLFNFLETSDADNEMLMGYFENVVKNLYKGRKVEVSIFLSS